VSNRTVYRTIITYCYYYLSSQYGCSHSFKYKNPPTKFCCVTLSNLLIHALYFYTAHINIIYYCCECLAGGLNLHRGQTRGNYYNSITMAFEAFEHRKCDVYAVIRFCRRHIKIPLVRVHIT
jgi:hypothetical protein